MMEIYIIQDLQSNWQGSILLDDILDDNQAQENVVLVDTDSTNRAWILALTGLDINRQKVRAILFLRVLSKGKVVVVDRIVDPIDKENLERRYLSARNSPIVLGDPSGVPLGDIIDLNTIEGKDAENDPLGLGLFNFNIDMPSWAWFILAGLAGFQGLRSRQNKSLWFAGSLYGIYNGVKKS